MSVLAIGGLPVRRAASIQNRAFQVAEIPYRPNDQTQRAVSGSSFSLEVSNAVVLDPMSGGERW
jgi:hypothetical protein